MLPANLLSCDLRGEEALPRFLGNGDRPWIRRLLEECDRAAGWPVRELVSRLGDPLPGVPDDRRRLVAHLLLRLARSTIEAPLPPREARAALFSARARSEGLDREAVIGRCAAALGVAPAALVSSLFADLPSERIAAAPGSLDPGELALRANLALAQGFLARAHEVRLAIEGNARAVVRHAALRGLLCSITRPPGSDGARVELSGPFALFRRTLLYGRALGAVVPVLAWTRRFRLEATCDLRGRRVIVTLGTGDPIFPAAEPRRFDSKLEERFAREFGRLAPDWCLVREPEPMEAGGHLFFPDFCVHPRHAPDARWFIEVVGFWTREYLARKLERLRQAGLERLVLCLDESRNVGADELPAGAAVVRYRRRIDPARVMEVIRGSACESKRSSKGSRPR